MTRQLCYVSECDYAARGWTARLFSRKAYRNGYEPGTLNTASGPLSFSKPQLRGQSFETGVFDRYSRVEKSLQLAVIESYLQGVSTRNVTEIIEKLGAGDISASAVSAMSKELDGKVDEFLNRPIDSVMAYRLLMQPTSKSGKDRSMSRRRSSSSRASGSTVAVRYSALG